MILDSSALLAYLRREDGAEAVRSVIVRRAIMSTVNLAEVLARGTDRGEDPQARLDELYDIGLLGDTIWIESFTAQDVVETARLRPLTRRAGLSLADRACLALARRTDLPALTADNAWSRVDVGVEIVQLR